MTAIQGLDFFFRKIVKDKGAALTYVAGQITELVKGRRRLAVVDAARA